MTYTEKRHATDLTWIITVYFILKTIYINNSGNMQIADYFLVIGFFLVLQRNNYILYIPSVYKRWLYFFAGVCLYQMIVGIIWSIITGETRVFVRSCFYLYNFLAVYLCIMLSRSAGAAALKTAIVKGCFLSLLLTAVGLIINRGSYRATGFFNNPNQLGFYALIMLTVLVVWPDAFNKKFKLIYIITCLFILAQSLSKAAIMGTFGLLMFYIFVIRKTSTRRELAINFFIILVLGILMYLTLYTSLFDSLRFFRIATVKSRLFSIMNETDSNLGTGRGYNRLFEIGGNILWGVGEGAYQRFDTLPGIEVHSTYINLIVSYGLLGFFAYVRIFLTAINNKGTLIHNLACFSGILLYSFTHNVIRNTLIWILIAAILIENNSATLGGGETGAKNELCPVDNHSSL